MLLLHSPQPNNSFKPSPLRGLGAAFVGTQRAGLTQALAAMAEIRAGHVNEADRSSGEWLFVDIGFSSKSRSCGLLGEQGQPHELTFSQTQNHLVEQSERSGRPLNIVLEAPLSVAFASNGNPVGRAIELRDGKSRYWYVGLGCSVLVATTYLIRAISDASRAREIRLFEGLVSFKPKGAASSHSNDVMLLRDVVWGTPGVGRLVPPDELAASTDHSLRSAFAVAGMDYGVPPVITVGG